MEYQIPDHFTLEQAAHIRMMSSEIQSYDQEMLLDLLFRIDVMNRQKEAFLKSVDERREELNLIPPLESQLEAYSNRIRLKDNPPEHLRHILLQTCINSLTLDNCIKHVGGQAFSEGYAPPGKSSKS